MAKYIMRLDDACQQWDVQQWNKMEELLDRYGVKPLVGVIPNCEDSAMASYQVDLEFWNRVESWIKKGWVVAMHGYNHVYSTTAGGLNPVNSRSEFAGEPLDIQKEKIKKGVAIMRQHGIDPQVFFAPSHTFDENTIVALKECSNIRIISDTIAVAPYTAYGMTFVPQQSGKVRKIPLDVVTFCYHPNVMREKDFENLDIFIKENGRRFIKFPMTLSARKRSVLDKMLNSIYMEQHK